MASSLIWRKPKPREGRHRHWSLRGAGGSILTLGAPGWPVCLNPGSHLPLLDLCGDEGKEVNPWGTHQESFPGARLSAFHHDRTCFSH